MTKHALARLSEGDRKALKQIVRGGEHKARVITRARILLLADRNNPKFETHTEICKRLDVCDVTVSATCRRDALEGLQAALSERPQPGSGAAPKMTGEVEAQLLLARCSKPPQEHARWTVGLLREHLIGLKLVDDISRMAVSNHCLQPQALGNPAAMLPP